LENYGPISNIITKVFNEMGINVEYKFYPWRRCEELVKKGEAFATFPYIVTPEREKIYFFSEPLYKSSGRIFYIKENLKEFNWLELEDLKKYRVGGVFGYWYELPFIKEGLSVDYSPTETIALHKLYNMRLDLVVGDEDVMWEIIRKNYPKDIDKFITAAKELNSDTLHLITSKNNEKFVNLMKEFNKTINKMKEEGKI
jgi:polar amino acid transport system substrate-binding protein